MATKTTKPRIFHTPHATVAVWDHPRKKTAKKATTTKRKTAKRKTAKKKARPNYSGL